MTQHRPIPTRPILVAAFLLLLGVSIRAFQVPQAVNTRDAPPNPALMADPISSGTLSVSPDYGVAGQFGTWTVAYRVGMEAIKTGGGLRVELPAAWHAGIRSSANRLQATDPSAPHYVRARASRSGVELKTIVELESNETLVKGNRVSNLSHLAGYYAFVTRVILLKGELRDGDTLAVVYGDTSQGSPGLRAGLITTAPQPILVAVDTEGRGQFRLHTQKPTLACIPGPASEMLLTASSEAVIGRPAILHIAVLDQFANPARGFSGKVALKLRTGQADLPVTVEMAAQKGWAEIQFTPRSAGVLRIEAFESGRGLEALSNPIEVSSTMPEEMLYWGDLHSHTQFSKADGLGAGEKAYEYARHISGLDFYAMTDHSDAQALTAADWPAYSGLAERFYAPGDFVTLHAYEASFYAPFGHHNVYFRGKPGPLLSPDNLTLPELWKALKAREALTIPHHTMKMPDPVDWEDADDPELRRNFEIYSAHGLSESYDPQHPLAFEQSLFTNPSVTIRRGMSAQRAWIEGFELSTIASSDDHRAHPGQPAYGIAAVRSRSLTREGIFDALYNRRTYGTTGVRIVLDFRINGTDMGQHVNIRGAVKVQIRALGTDVIDSIELLRHIEGEKGFHIVHEASPARESVELQFEDRPSPGKAIYYVRLRQRRLVRERIAMAWSSPIWANVQ